MATDIGAAESEPLAIGAWMPGAGGSPTNLSYLSADAARGNPETAGRLNVLPRWASMVAWRGAVRRGGQPPVRAARHQPRSAPGKRPTTSTLSALTLITSRSGFATASAGSPASSKYMSLTIRR